MELDFAVALLVRDAGRDINGMLHGDRSNLWSGGYDVMGKSKVAGLLYCYFVLLFWMLIKVNKLGWLMLG